MTRIVLIGVGSGGRDLLSLLFEDPEVHVLGVATRTQDSSGQAFARELGLFTTTSIEDLMALSRIDVVIDASGSEKAQRQIVEHCPIGTEVIAGLSLSFMWNMVDERIRRERDQRALYDIGLMLTTANSQDDVLKSILKSATELIEAPAASIALYHEEDHTLELCCSQGFSEGFIEVSRWPVRKGGLSDQIINSNKPMVFDNTDAVPSLDNTVMISEGIRAIAAVPLKARGRTIGVLYVDDFKVRHFDDREVSLLGLLAHQAALAIEKAQLLEEKEHIAATDGLTGLYNHRRFKQQLGAEVERAARYNQTFCVAMFDLDFFKTINDRLGHTKGDEVLAAVASTLQTAIRNTDFCARYGGEEFAVILPHTTLHESHYVVDKIRKAISEVNVEGVSGSRLRLTASAGVADFPACGSSIDSMISAADSAMIQAKRSGRDRVCYSPDVDEPGTSDDPGITARMRGHDFVAVGALVAAIQARDGRDRSIAAVAAEKLTSSLRLGAEEKEALVLGVLVHNHGHPKTIRKASLAVDRRPDRLPGGLSDTEWKIINMHSESVGRVLQTLQGLSHLAPTIIHHHENWDGSGTPDGLSGEDIPILARLLSVCEAYQELMEPPPKGSGLAPGEAVAALRKMAGKELDPALVDIMCSGDLIEAPIPDKLGSMVTTSAQDGLDLNESP